VATNFTDEDLQRLDRAIGTGALAVTFSDGRRVEFSTFAELVKRRNYIARQLDEESGRQRLYTKYDKGVTP
jgi:hypothetical protein